MTGIPVGVGDIVAISQLIFKIGNELKKSPEATAHYQDLLIELEALERALRQVQNIRPNVHDLKQLESIRALVATCQQPLKAFLDKISEFESHLGTWSASGSRLRGFGKRVQWTTLYKDDVAELRSRLAPKLFTISILLSTQNTDTLGHAELDRHDISRKLTGRLFTQQIFLGSLERRTQASLEAQNELAGIQTRLELKSEAQLSLTLDVHAKADILLTQGDRAAHSLQSHGILLSQIRNQSATNGADLQTVKGTTASILSSVGKLQRTSTSILGMAIDAMSLVVACLSKLHEITALFSRLTELAGAMTIEMRQAVAEHLRCYWDIHRTLTRIENYLPFQIYQPPQIWFRDAFNVRRPFLWELSRDWMKFKGLVTVVFMGQQGLHRVVNDQFYITHGRLGGKLNPQFWRNAIEPGDELTMTMILDEYEAEEGFCPWKSCRTDIRNVELSDGRKYCPKCHRHVSVAEKRISTVGTPNSERSLPFKPGGGRLARIIGNPTAQEEVENLSKRCDFGDLVAAPTAENKVAEDIELYHSIHVGRIIPVAIEVETEPTSSEFYNYKYKPYGRKGSVYVSPYSYDDLSPQDTEDYVYYEPQYSATPQKKHSRKPSYTSSPRQGVWNASSSYQPFYDDPPRYETYSYARYAGQYRGTPHKRHSMRTANYNSRTGYASPYVYENSANSTYIYGEPATRKQRRKAGLDDNYYYLQPEHSYYGQPRRSRTRRPSQSDGKTTTKTTIKSVATEKDLLAAGIPAGYSTKNWDPSEAPIILLGSVFDANSLGKWIYDWTVYHLGVSTPMADVAGDFWLLLIKLAGKVKRAEELVARIADKSSQEIVEDFIESGLRLWKKLKLVLKECEKYMWIAAKREVATKAEKKQPGVIEGHATSSGKTQPDTGDGEEFKAAVNREDPSASANETAIVDQGQDDSTQAAKKGESAPRNSKPSDEEDKEQISSKEKAKAGNKASMKMGRNAGIEFVDTIFGRDRELERTENLMSSIRLWVMRFDVNCEDVLRNPGPSTTKDPIVKTSLASDLKEPTSDEVIEVTGKGSGGEEDTGAGWDCLDQRTDNSKETVLGSPTAV